MYLKHTSENDLSQATCHQRQHITAVTWKHMWVQQGCIRKCNESHFPFLPVCLTCPSPSRSCRLTSLNNDEWVSNFLWSNCWGISFPFSLLLFYHSFQSDWVCCPSCWSVFAEVLMLCGRTSFIQMHIILKNDFSIIRCTLCWWTESVLRFQIHLLWR